MNQISFVAPARWLRSRWVTSALLVVAATFSIAASAQTTGTSGLESLENFVKTTKSGRAVFTQVVTSPAKDGQVAKTKTSGGTFEFLRPNRFRFVYKKPFEQSIVSDGQTLWLYDVDLNQVTSRKLAQVLNGRFRARHVRWPWRDALSVSDGFV